MGRAVKLGIVAFALAAAIASAQAEDKHHGGDGGGHGGKSPADALGALHSHGAAGAVGSHLGGALDSRKALGAFGGGRDAERAGGGHQNPLGLFGLNGQHGGGDRGGGDRGGGDRGGGNGGAIGQAIGGF